MPHALACIVGRLARVPAARQFNGHRRLRTVNSFLQSTDMHCFSTTSVMPLPQIDLRSATFSDLRRRNHAYVDKTVPIAALLKNDDLTTRCFFYRPRKFGKTLTLDVMAAMLSAGKFRAPLLQPWKNYEPVDVDALFNGLGAYSNLKEGSLLQSPHFVVFLSFVGVQTGAKLETEIIAKLGAIAGKEFGEAAKADVIAAPGPGTAFNLLVDCVPKGVPVALLIDEYDAPVIADIMSQRWEDAKSGIQALNSLISTTKDVSRGRINRCIVTGVARFAPTSLFAGANQFNDISHNALLSRAIGFSESEIVAHFSTELQQLGANLSRSLTPKKREQAALRVLREWYNGYCFDGETTCYHPFPVLSALKAGHLTEQAATGKDWPSLTPDTFLSGSSKQLLADGCIQADLDNPDTLDIEDLEHQTTNPANLLLQVGSLTLLPSSKSKASVTTGLRRCIVPNKYARNTILQGLHQDMPPVAIRTLADEMEMALRSRDHQAFSASIAKFVEATPFTSPIDESTFQACLWWQLLACLPHDLHAEAERMVGEGRMDFNITFPRRSESWTLGFGVGVSFESKFKQAQSYLHSQSTTRRLAGVFILEHTGKASLGKKTDTYNCTFRWREWDANQNMRRSWDSTLNTWSAWEPGHVFDDKFLTT